MQQLRRDSYAVIIQAKKQNKNLCNIGSKMNILPRTYTGSPRYMQGKYQDALAILGAFRSKPDLFITMTANPEWPEITQAIELIKIEMILLQEFLKQN